jgi:ditrans,polycis-polyprenyl diphosphate synthase
MAKVMVLTRHNTRAKLNVAFAYTSRNEITRGIRSIEKGLFDGDIALDDVTEDLLEDSFRILPSQPLDLLVRTSGETRLSDFLLWQSAETVLCFTHVLWPEFTIWHLMAAMFNYQVNCMSIKQLKLMDSASDSDSKESSRKNLFISNLSDTVWQQLEKEAAVLS